jgi:capsular polysaccharide biosynthesis protein
VNLIAVGRLALRRGWIAVLLTIVGAALGLLVAITQTPVFEAVTRVAVRPVRPADLGQTQAIREVMSSYVQDVSTVDMAVAVSARLAEDARCAGFDLDPGHLLSMLRTSTDLNVYDIQVRARSRDPAEAVCVSEKWSEAFVDRRESANLQLDPLDRIVVEQRDITAEHRVWPQRRLIVLVAALAGLLLGVLVILGLEYLEGRFVRRADDAERQTGAAVLAAIPPAEGARGSGPAIGAVLDAARAAVSPAVRIGAPVVLLAVLGGAVALALSMAEPDVWRARTRIAVEPARGSDWGQTQAIREIMKGYSEDIKTRRMAEEVNETLQLDRSPDDLLAQLNVAPKEGVYEIVVDFKDQDRTAAEAVSRAWATSFVEQRTQANLVLDQRDRILTRLRDVTVAERWQPKPVSNTASGAVLGAIVGASLVFALGMLKRTTVRSAAEAAAVTGAPVVARLPSSRRRAQRPPQLGADA